MRLSVVVKKAIIKKVITLALLLSIISNVSHMGVSNVSADTTAPNASSASSEVRLDQFDAVCGNILSGNSSNPSASSGTSEQLKSYCKAAQSSMDAAKADGILWKVWAAVAGVCVAACAASFAGLTNQYVCILSDVGAGAADAIVTKNFTSALMALGGGAASYFINSSFSKTKTTTNKEGEEIEKVSKKDIGACIIAATAGFQVYMDYTHEQNELKNAKANLASAANANSSSTVLPQVYPITQPNGPSLGTSGTTGTQTALNLPTTHASAEVQPQACLEALSSESTGAMLNCAAAKDSGIPAYVTSPRFADDFKKASGQDLGSFLNQDPTPTQALVAAGGGTLSPSQLPQLAMAASRMESQILSPDTTYRSSGGSGNNNSSVNSNALPEEMLAGIMNRFLPQKSDHSDRSLSSVITYQKQDGAPWISAENRELSIFDRISYRYHFVGKRMVSGAGNGDGS